MNDKEYVSYIWHFKVEDDLGWEFCSGYMKMNEYADISPEELEYRFKKYFKDNMGIEPYSKCPLCGKELLPRESRYGYFIGCSEYPKCKFIATDKKPYKSEQEEEIK